MNLQFEHHYQQKVMEQSFNELTVLETKRDVLKWRSLWTGELKSWHSPYKALIDCSNLKLVGHPEELRRELELMIRFFEGLFLRKVVAYGYASHQGHEFLPFDVVNDREAAAQSAGLKAARDRPEPGDLRSAIVIQNDFQRHVVELAFSVPVSLDDPAKIAILRSKLTNNLMQWHSKWSLLIDCENLNFGPNATDDFQKMERALKGFFLKLVIGYGVVSDAAAFPFKVHRSRHRAVAQLESEGMQDGDKANCNSRKESQPN